MTSMPGMLADGGTDRLPPHNLEAEQAVLGSLLIDRDAIIQVADWLKPSAFFHGANATIYATILLLYHRRKPADFILVCDVLEKRKQLEKVGGPAYLSSLISATPTAVNVGYYAGLVQDCALQRTVIDVGAAIVSEGYEGTADVEQLVGKLRADTLPYTMRETTGGGFYADTMDAHLEQTIDRWEGTVVEELLPTGFPAIDKAIYGGFRGGDLIYIGGISGAGKSSLALQLAHQGARYLISRGIPKQVLYVTLEMSEESMRDRAIALEARLPFGTSRSTVLPLDQKVKWVDTGKALADLPVAMRSDLWTTDLIRSYCERALTERAVAGVIIDHIGKLDDSFSGNMQADQRMTKISGSLKRMANELSIPVIGLSTLNRETEAKPPFVPSMRNLSASHRLGYDADFVIFPYRRKMFVEMEMMEASDEFDFVHPKNFGMGHMHKVMMILAKNRNGEKMSFPMGFEPKTMRFFEIAA